MGKADELRVYWLFSKLWYNNSNFERWSDILKKSYRVKREQDFNRIFSEGKNVANRKFVVYRLPKDQKHFRVGLSVSKKLGNAVTRNAIKRKIRHVLIECQSQLVPDDFVIIDCGIDPNDPIDTIRTGQKLYIENLKDSKKDFFQLNTRVTIENGIITEINRHWIP